MSGCEGYNAIARVYDKLNAEIDYEGWADFFESCFDRFLSERPSLVLDLACGTGRMTRELARRGYDMTGVDNSVEMLDIARNSSAEYDILWLCQDMSEFELYGTVDVTVSCLDSINHITDTKKLKKCFELVHNYLIPDGLFIFDLNTRYKFENVYADNTFVEFEGVITGFYDPKGVYVTDPITGFSIWCFNSNRLPFNDVEYVGRKVKVSGDKIHYIGQLEVAHAEIELVGEEKVEVKPIELDLTDENLNISDYLGYYVVVRGKVVEKVGKCTYLENSDIYLFAFYPWFNSLYISVGDTVEVTGWVHVYNQVSEVLYDSRLIKIIEE
jgi:SAM-dependent methyltransferase